MLPRELYLPPAGDDKAQWMTICYIDGALTREEVHSTSGESDAYFGFVRRISTDNGRTWSTPQPIPNVTQQLPDGGMADYPGNTIFDPALGIAYQKRMLRTWPGMKLYTYNWSDHEHPYSDHTFVVENGVDRLMRYEDGPDYDPERPFDPAFTVTNRAYYGVGMALGSDGAAYFPIVCFKPGAEFSYNRAGLVLMRRDPATGQWAASTQQYLTPEESSRGLLEPDVAVLKDGRILIICRGSDTPTTPGRKWFSVSEDGGKTLSPLEELRYDDGSRFYSPSSIHRLVRSARNGRL